MTFKDRFDRSFTLFVLGTLATGFTAGVGAVTLAATIAGTTWVSTDRLASLEKAQSNSGAEMPVPCHQIAGWPKGDWWLWGHIRSDWTPTRKDEKFPQYATRVTFVSNGSYRASNNINPSSINVNPSPLAPPGQNLFVAQLSPPLTPPLKEEEVTYDFSGKDETGFTAKGFLWA